eukprot:gnl/MRDRNA2_/MRDRNA2_95102_c0_seq1.p1 gnl/MRDRNA2_/MRDRNA2_95102_c0~~gnl/MRDRNA2_/MRDRNA2_95102_c0_seq1.p1  ORF type:complete len:375 (-),score=70.45 gnl/MRDRNA2_/MRDRNA2_95102_c0_seq1:76-1200(-)
MALRQPLSLIVFFLACPPTCGKRMIQGEDRGQIEADDGIVEAPSDFAVEDSGTDVSLSEANTSLGWQTCKSLCLMTVDPIASHGAKVFGKNYKVLGHLRYIKRVPKMYNYVCYHEGLKAKDITSHAVDKKARNNLLAMFGYYLDYSNTNAPGGKGISKLTSNSGKELYQEIRLRDTQVSPQAVADLGPGQSIPQYPYPVTCDDSSPELVRATCRQETLPLDCPKAIQQYEDFSANSKVQKDCKGNANEIKKYSSDTATFRAKALSSNLGGKDSPEQCFEEWKKLLAQVQKKEKSLDTKSDKAGASAAKKELENELKAEVANEALMKKQEQEAPEFKAAQAENKKAFLAAEGKFKKLSKEDQAKLRFNDDGSISF